MLSDKVAKLALVLSLITLVLVVGGVLTTYFVVRDLVRSQVDKTINFLNELKFSKFSIPIRIDRVIELPVNTSVPISYVGVVDFPLNESLRIPVVMDIPVEVPMSIPVEVPLKTSIPINYSTNTKTTVVLGGTPYELEIPINISTEAPVEVTVKTVVNYTGRTVVHINTTLPVTISKTVKVPINTSLQLPINQVFKVPIKLDITYEVTLKDLGLDKIIDQLIAVLEGLKSKV